jgi:hypothetical protein
MADEKQEQKKEKEKAAPRLRPGSGVSVVDRYEGLYQLHGAIITGTNQCDEGNFNLRIISDIHSSKPDMPLSNVRVYEKGMKAEAGERFFIIPEGVDWPLTRKPEPKADKPAK